MNSDNADRKGQVVYFSHGGGPLPILGDKSHAAMVAFMQQLPGLLTKPEAIVVVSAHWEEKVPTLLGSISPSMFYDYYGFPEESYSIQYPAPGEPALADTIADLFRKQDLEVSIDSQRGFDHGLYIPLMMMYPEADIPSIQLSLTRGLNPVHHLKVGNALRELLNENVLIVGSGFSFHNMHAFVWNGEKPADPANDQFQDWLIDVCTNKNYQQQEREKLLADWRGAPSSGYCHPREEHLMPVHVCQGAAGNAGDKVFDDYILGKRSVAFLWK